MSNEEFPCARRKVVGETWIESDEVVKVTKTKNTEKSVIHRSRTRAIVLDCGHTMVVTQYRKVPTNNTICHECDRPRVEAERKRLHARWAKNNTPQ